MLDGSRYNASVDVYSFAITMFECACGRDHTRKQFRSVTRYAVCADTGWRPTPTTALKEKHPLVLALIQECWRSEQTKVKGALASVVSVDIAKRPTFMDIVARLETVRPASSLAVDSDELDLFPRRAARFINETIRVTKWRLALQIQNEESLRELHTNHISEEQDLFNDTGPEWRSAGLAGIPANARAEWRKGDNGLPLIYRFTLPLKCKDPGVAFKGAMRSVGTEMYFCEGDRLVFAHRRLARLDNDDTFAVLWQAVKVRVIHHSAYHLIDSATP